MNFSQKFRIDKIDKAIISRLQEEPEIEEEELADELGLSKEVVGARITKLIRKKLLRHSYGVNFKETDLVLARIDFYALHPARILQQFERCPFGLNLFKTSGEFNFSLMLVGANMRQIEEVVDRCLRNNPNVQNIRTTYVLDSVREFTLQLSFDLENVAEFGCIAECDRAWVEGRIDDPELVEILSRGRKNSSKVRVSHATASK
ncbi:MAG: hypothetical protein Kow0069_04920 [Promethearchaeota archaeon]